MLALRLARNPLNRRKVAVEANRYSRHPAKIGKGGFQVCFEVPNVLRRAAAQIAQRFNLHRERLCMARIESMQPQCERLSLEGKAFLELDSCPVVTTKECGNHGVQSNFVFARFFIAPASMKEIAVIGASAAFYLDFTSPDASQCFVKPFVICLACAAAYGFQKCVCFEVADVAERMQSRQMRDLLPHIEV